MFEVACRAFMARFVITYRGLQHPSSEEEREVLSSLAATTIVDRMPGMLLVEGSESIVAAAIDQHKAWSFSAEARLTPQPNQRR